MWARLWGARSRLAHRWGEINYVSQGGRMAVSDCGLKRHWIDVHKADHGGKRCKICARAG